MSGKWYRVDVEGGDPIDVKVQKVREAVAKNGNDAEIATDKGGTQFVAVFVRKGAAGHSPRSDLEGSLDGIACEFSKLKEKHLSKKEWTRLKRG
jgi:hypothetical protein